MHTLKQGGTEKMTAEETTKLTSVMGKLMTALKERPERRAEFAKVINENPTLQRCMLVARLATMCNVCMRAYNGATKEEVIEIARPFTESDEELEQVGTLWDVLQLQRTLGLLMGEDYHDMKLEDVYTHIGIRPEELETLAPEEFIQRIDAAGPPKKTWTDSANLALDLIFEQRYGWPSGTASKMGFEEKWIALENTLDDKMDDPKGIWKLTQ
jgi:hypothetical protein